MLQLAVVDGCNISVEASVRLTHLYMNMELYYLTVDRVAQSVKRLTTGWTVRGSNPCGGEIFRTSRPALGPTQPSVQWVPGLSRG
jgi:hypothetical protein